MTGRIAPDEGREIDLVLAGTKPLAVIEKRKDPDQYAQALAMIPDSFSTVFVTPLIGSEGPEAVVYRFVRNFRRYQDALAMPEGDAKTRAMGKLFGYSEADIEEFITNPPACDCSKCSNKAVKYGSATDAARRTQFHAK